MWNAKLKRRVRWMCVGACVSLTVDASGSQLEPSTRDHGAILVDGSSGRPLSEAVATLEERYGWVITYEDPPFEHESETEDVTARVRRDGNLTKKVIVPKGAPFTFLYDLAPDGKTPADPPMAVLTRLLNDYALSGNPGEFKVIESDGAFHVIPAKVRSAAGDLVACRSVLETRISLPEESRSVDEMVQAVFRAITAASGARIFSGLTGNLYLQTRVRDGAKDQRARDVLTRALAATGRRVSWRLRYQPGTQHYGFSAHVVGSGR